MQHHRTTKKLFSTLLLALFGLCAIAQDKIAAEGQGPNDINRENKVVEQQKTCFSEEKQLRQTANVRSTGQKQIGQAANARSTGQKQVGQVHNCLFSAGKQLGQAQDDRLPEGTWSGELEVRGVKLPLVFHFTPEGCTMDSPMQGAKGIKAEISQGEDGSITINVPSIGAKFEGIMVLKMLTGRFYQGGMGLPLTLKPGDFAPKRPQTPTPPYPYDTEEVSILCPDGYKLHGTLTRPKDCSRKTTAVVLITGSGIQDRDETLFEHKPFAVIADALTRAGIATLRCDDRGFDDKQPRDPGLTTEHFRKDAETQLDFMRQCFDHVGILGHSEGGTIGLMLAAEAKTDFVVSMAGMAVSGKETLIAQNQKWLADAGMPEGTKAQYLEALNNIFDQIADGKTAEQINLDGVSPEIRTEIAQALPQLASPYFRHFITLDPRQHLESVTCPVLALGGKRDIQVNWQTNLSALEEGLANSRHDIVSFEGLNHLFQHCTTGAVAEYGEIEETISDEVLRKIVDWIIQTADR